METLLVHRDIAYDFLPRMASRYKEAKVELRGDEETRRAIGALPATEEDWKEEYNDTVLSIKVVSSLDEAIEHVNRFSSHHTDSIITSDHEAAARFMDLVDSSSVMWNASTRFQTDATAGRGGGDIYNKTHARGPVGLEGLVIYKYKLRGNGQTVAEYVGKGGRRFTHRKII